MQSFEMSGRQDKVPEAQGKRKRHKGHTEKGVHRSKRLCSFPLPVSLRDQMENGEGP